MNRPSRAVISVIIGRSKTVEDGQRRCRLEVVEHEGGRGSGSDLGHRAKMGRRGGFGEVGPRRTTD